MTISLLSNHGGLAKLIEEILNPILEAQVSALLNAERDACYVAAIGLKKQDRVFLCL